MKIVSGKLAGEHLIEHDTERIDVRAVIDFGWMLDLLGGHVLRRADDFAGFREHRVARCMGSRGWLIRSDEFGDAEVRDLHAA